MNIAITSAVVIAFPVFIDVSILFPSNPSNEPCAAVTNKCTRLLFINNKNLINIGASAINTPPNKSLIKLSLASFFLAVFIPAIIILYAKINTAIKIKLPDITPKILYHCIVLVHNSLVNGDKLSLSALLLKIRAS